MTDASRKILSPEYRARFPHVLRPTLYDRGETDTTNCNAGLQLHALLLSLLFDGRRRRSIEEESQRDFGCCSLLLIISSTPRPSHSRVFSLFFSPFLPSNRTTFVSRVCVCGTNYGQSLVAIKTPIIHREISTR